MRTNKELLQLLLDNIYLLRTGLCGVASRLNNSDVITYSEYYKIKDYISNNRPTQGSKLYDSTQVTEAYYWKQEDKEPRVRWLKYHIKICKS